MALFNSCLLICSNKMELTEYVSQLKMCIMGKNSGLSRTGKCFSVQIVLLLKASVCTSSKV